MVTAAPAVSALDITGEVCPYTFVRTKLALEALPPGALLDIITDHHPATENIPRSLALQGHRHLSTTPGPPWVLRVQKGHSPGV